MLSLSERMARIRKVDTKPEIVVRRLVHRLGYRFRLHRPDLPGVPDIVFPSRRKVIFVHGCFWHRHSCPDGRKFPKSKPSYWRPKLKRNAARDREHIARLQEMGWSALVLWGCELHDPEKLRARVQRFLDRPFSPSG